MSEDADLVLTAGAVAHQLGVAVPTLRSWDRRYGLGPSAHEAGRHRRYNAEDLARLREMVSLIGEGVPPGSAARLVLTRAPEFGSRRDGGGSGALAVGRSGREVRGLVRAATRLDVQAVQRLVEKHLHERGVQRAWEEILAPVLRSIGESYEQQGDEVVGIEHTTTAGFLTALHGVAPLAVSGRLPALLACAPEEQHTLPLEALHAVLAELGCASRFLGPRVPSEAVSRAARKLRPRSVVFWAHHARLARRIALAEVALDCDQIVLCGPGWDEVRAAHRHVRVASLPEAMQVVLDATPASSRDRRSDRHPPAH